MKKYLILILILLIIYYIATSRKPEESWKMPKLAWPPATNPQQGVIPHATSSSERSTTLKNMIHQYHLGKTNPFQSNQPLQKSEDKSQVSNSIEIPSPTSMVPSQVTPPTATPSPPILKGILSGEAAIIYYQGRDRLVSPGSKLSPYTVKQIRETQVTLTSPQGNTILTLSSETK